MSENTNYSDKVVGRFGEFGGQYIPETLMNEIHKLEAAYEHYKNDPEFVAELDKLNREYAGRPSLLYYAEKMSRDLGGAFIYYFVYIVLLFLSSGKWRYLFGGLLLGAVAAVLCYFLFAHVRVRVQVFLDP